MPVKLLGLFLIFLGGALSSAILNRSLASRLKRSEALLSLIRFIRLQIDLYCLPIDEIFRRADPELYTSLGLSSPPHSFTELKSSLDPPPDGELGRLVESFDRELGASFRDDQLRVCDYHLARLSELHERSVDEIAQKRKLNRTLCLGAAIAIIILLI